ncbi:glycoside hydrolase family 125 protein [Lacticaseibacillus camelliae]|uniref:Glycosyl hydrolase n=1 Tax=Lacticaseibacillus camelliae DSM 22697 = JCM 13995 TaxID=1423730 RepID=A0A0R2FL32_9LACO|nr:glycoside hydrolase family 125 protein [Lacticaseibacillus camelliae]KRN25895.1 hypothetical protein FC75_GL002028 [Lacticaseibacillus camelliae DSM 22697 = JCM 13995]
MTNTLTKSEFNQIAAHIEKAANKSAADLDPAIKHLFTSGIHRFLTENIHFSDGRLYVITGDIPAMWHRDSTFQMLPLLHLVKEVPEVTKLAAALLETQMYCIQLDPYANSFSEKPNQSIWGTDHSNITVNASVWERKYELNSLTTPIHLAYALAQLPGQTAQKLPKSFWQTVPSILTVMKTEQRHESSPYRFERPNGPASDTLPNAGKGTPVGYTGMIWSGFRPSDDACQYGYLIPDNLYAAHVLDELGELIKAANQPQTLADEAAKLAADIRGGVERFGHATHNGETILAYEVDGLGHQLLMDDANLPSLLSLPYLDTLPATDPLYQATRRFALSTANPYYYTGSALAGVGSPHTPEGYVWPLSVIVEAATSTDPAAIQKALDTLVATDAGTGHIHESIDANDPKNFTRESFSWADMTFCNLVLLGLEKAKTN